jgi:hypothetical protein
MTYASNSCNQPKQEKEKRIHTFFFTNPHTNNICKNSIPRIRQTADDEQ